MLSIEFFLKGILVGLLVSAPMGPIGVLCVQKTLNKGRFLGFFSGLGAATADTTYAILAAFGISYITSFLEEYRIMMQIIGIVVLIFLGIKMLVRTQEKQFRYYRSGSHKSNAITDFISVFFLTISNPLTIIFFGAAFSMLGLLSDKVGGNLSLVSGIFSGAVMWWFALTYSVDAFRKKFSLRSILMLNRISGALIIILSIALAIKFFLFN